MLSIIPLLAITEKRVALSVLILAVNLAHNSSVSEQSYWAQYFFFIPCGKLPSTGRS
ncbi:hypothetical protein T09_3462 [Trichinella sp. T9]|nr:hypothetical protein T09_3462 [Trichinella sp. T9]